MNGNRIITPAITIALLLAAALSSSCTREGLIARRGINFKAQSTGFLSPERATKTAYSGLPSEGQQCIEWIDGDVIRVYSPQAYVYEKPSVHETDFRVKSHSNASLISTATITPSADANSLQWNNDAGEHAFYAMYPTPSGGNTFNEGTMVFTMPATQAPLSSSTSAGTIELVPHMASYAPMLASKTGLDPAANPTVPLAFTPQFTAFEVVINKGAYTTVNLSEFKIKGAEGDKLAGTFTVSAGSYNAVASIADASNVITMDLNGDDEDSTDDLGLLDSDNPNLKLTVFTLPQTFSSGITLEFKGSFDGGATATRRITLKTAGGAFVQFDPYCKYRISGLSFPVVVDATIDDSISWDFSLQIMDSVIWWIGAEAVNNIDWIDDLDFDAYTELRDEVKWFSGAHIEQDFAWEELDHIALSSDDDLYLWRTETAQRTVTAVNRSGNIFSDVSASWSCSPSSGVIYLNQSTGEIRAIAPGHSLVTATVTPNDGSTPYTLSYNVYVNAPTGITLTAVDNPVSASGSTTLTATLTCTANGTIPSLPADLLEWTSSTTTAVTLSDAETQPATATLQATATANGVAAGTSDITVKVATKYADAISTTLTLTVD